MASNRAIGGELQKRVQGDKAVTIQMILQMGARTKHR
jgi:hypothetical protein